MRHVEVQTSLASVAHAVEVEVGAVGQNVLIACGGCKAAFGDQQRVARDMRGWWAVVWGVHFKAFAWGQSVVADAVNGVVVVVHVNELRVQTIEVGVDVGAGIARAHAVCVVVSALKKGLGTVLFFTEGNVRNAVAGHAEVHSGEVAVVDIDGQATALGLGQLTKLGCRQNR